MRVVLDVNVLVSAIGWEGPPSEVLLACRQGRLQIFLTTEILDELARVLAYPKLARLARHADLPVILAWLYRPEHLVVPTRTITVIEKDPADNRILEAAVAGRAEAIVSGDDDLLGLGQFEGIPIVTAAAFLDRLAGAPPEGRGPTPDRPVRP